jgi:hypothetical protein
MAEAERTGEAHGCAAVQGTCFSFQSPGFFRKLGYETFGVADVFLDGHTQDLPDQEALASPRATC